MVWPWPIRDFLWFEGQTEVTAIRFSLTSLSDVDKFKRKSKTIRDYRFLS